MSTPPPSGGEPPSHRACAHCRSQKVRCIPDDGNPDVCSRCAKSGRPCVFTPLQKRKQRKRTDTRVAELEREMRMMRTMLKHKQDGAKTPPHGAAVGGVPPAAPPAQGLWYEKNVQEAPRIQQAVFHERPRQRGSEDRREDSMLGQAIADVPSEAPAATTMQSTQGQSHGGSPLWPHRFPEKPAGIVPDVVDRGLLSMATARQLFETYRRDLFPHYPTVAVPESTTADEMRASKPTLFLAIIAAAAGKENSDLSATLDKEVLEAYATRSLMYSEKSLELVQSLLISAVWYHPPSKFGQLKYYEYIHMAATMAMDIGIGTRPKVLRGRLGNAVRGREPAKQALAVHPIEDASNPDLSMTPRSRDSSPDTGSLESRRTFLACYMICSGVSLSLRRPNMLRVSSYVRECVDYLERSPDAIPTDRALVHWTRLAIIAEEISTSFSYDDPGGIASITELRTQLMLKDFEKKLTSWWQNVPEADGNGSLTIMYYSVRLYLHEIALHVDHSPEDFKAPYQMGTIQPWLSGSTEDIPSQVLADCIADCISSSHALLNTFFAMDPESLRALPVFSYVRVSFAAFVLAKLCLSASHPGSRIGRVLDKSALKAETYMDRAVLHVRNIVGTKRCRVPAIFLALLFKLRQWCLNPEMIEAARGAGVTEPYDELRRGGALPGAESRTVEQVDQSENSSSDASPESQPSGGQPTLFGTAPSMNASTSYPVNTGLTPDSLSPPAGAETSSTAYVSVPGDQSNVPAAMADQSQWLPVGTDEMQLDSEFMQYFGNDLDLSGGFPEGGLTGLDDWMPMPADLTGMGQVPAQMPTQMPPVTTGGAFGYIWADSG